MINKQINKLNFCEIELKFVKEIQTSFIIFVWVIPKIVELLTSIRNLPAKMSNRFCSSYDWRKV